MFTTAYAKRRVAADVHWLDSAVVMPRSLRQCSAYRRSCPKSHLLFNKNHLSNCQRTVVSEASPRRDLNPRLSVTRLSCLIDGTYYSTYADSTQQYFSKIFFISPPSSSSLTTLKPSFFLSVARLRRSLSQSLSPFSAELEASLSCVTIIAS